MEFFVETERLILRDLREEDTQIIISQFADPLIRNQILPHQADADYNREYVRRAIIVACQKPRDYFALAITLKDCKTVVGSCSIYKVFPESVDCELGWNLGKEFWRKGYATETTTALLKIGFEFNDVSRISADCFADNIAAIRVLEKAGMNSHSNNAVSKWLRTLKYRETRPIVKYDILRDQWFKIQKVD